MSESSPQTPDSIEPQNNQSALPPLRDILVLICAVGLIACFFAPWTRVDQNVSAYTFQKLDKMGFILWGIPMLAFTVILVHKDKTSLPRLGIITAVVAWASVLYFLYKISSIGLFSLKWGASFTVLFALGLFAFSGERKFILPLDLVAKKLSSRKAEVYSHWGTLTPDIHFSTQEFYQQIEDRIKVKEWPGVQLFRVFYEESGFLSHKREYLRIIRQRHVFDVCAATFGKDYFFSVREAQIPAVVDLRAFVVVMLGVFSLLVLFIQTLGLIFGLFALVFLLITAVWFLFNILKLGLGKVDSALLTLPVIGPVYEAWFRQDTYFQQDTRIIFLQCVGELVKHQVEETTSAKGLKLLNCFEKKPILDGLYKPTVLALNP